MCEVLESVNSCSKSRDSVQRWRFDEQFQVRNAKPLSRLLGGERYFNYSATGNNFSLSTKGNPPLSTQDTMLKSCAPNGGIGVPALFLDPSSEQRSQWHLPSRG